MDDLTIIYYTANRVKHTFRDAVIKQLHKACGDSPIVSVSQKPMDFGHNICVGKRVQHVWNIYDQLLTGAKAAETKYVATAEDDILYSYEHYHERYPSEGVFLYDTHRYILFTWGTPMFTRKGRVINGMMICERELLIEALEERFARYPSPESIDVHRFGELGRHDVALGVTNRKLETFSASVPSIMFNHENTVTFADMGRRKMGGVDPTKSLPVWGAAEDILKLYGNDDSIHNGQ